MKIPGGKIKWRNICILPLLILMLSLAGCSASKTYWLFLRAAPTTQGGGATKLTIGVLPFEDNRPNKEKLGKRLLSSGKEEPIRLRSSSPMQDITSILLQLLEKRDIRTVELKSWEPAPENLKDLPEGVDIALAGKVEALEVQAKSSTFKTEIRYLVKLSAKLGYKGQGKVVTKAVEDRPEESVVRFKRQDVEKALNESLSSALERLIDAAISSAGQK